MLALRHHGQPEGYWQWILRTEEPLVQAGRFGTWTRREMNSIGAGRLFFVLTFRLCPWLFFFFLFFLRGVKYWPLTGASRKLVTDLVCLENQNLSLLSVDSGGYVNVISLSLRFIDSMVASFYCREKNKSLYLKRIARNCRGTKWRSRFKKNFWRIIRLMLLCFM